MRARRTPFYDPLFEFVSDEGNVQTVLVGHDFGPAGYLLLNVFLIPSLGPAQSGQSVQVEEYHAIVSDLLTQFERYFVEPGQHLSYDVRNSEGHFTNCLTRRMIMHERWSKPSNLWVAMR